MGFVCFQRMILADHIRTTLKHCKSHQMIGFIFFLLVQMQIGIGLMRGAQIIRSYGQ